MPTTPLQTTSQTVATYTPNWSKYGRPAFTAQQLDELMKFVMNSGTGYIGAIIAGIKILFIGAYMIARDKMVNQSMQVDRYEAEKELNSHHGNQNEVNN